MGTRGLTGITVDGNRRFAYQQYDSYPDGVGLDVLHFAHSLAVAAASVLDAAIEQARALVSVDETANPTAEQVAQLGERFHQQVSTGGDWYSYLRGTQGQPALILESGFIAARENPYVEDLWIEWSYEVDLTGRRLVGYYGSPSDPPERRGVIWSFDSLPTDAEFVERMNREAE